MTKEAEPKSVKSTTKSSSTKADESRNETSTTSSTLSETKNESSTLTIDGVLGEKTIARWQQVMGVAVGTSYVGALVEVVQRRLKVTVNHRLEVDGDPKALNFDVQSPTVENLERYLGVRVTRTLSASNSDVIKVLQQRLNEGRF